MKNIRNFAILLVLSLSMFSRNSIAEDIEQKAFKELIKNSNKEMKDYCYQNGEKYFISDFLEKYISWTLKDKEKTKQSFKCLKPANENFYQCTLNYGEPAFKGVHLGWDLDLEFKFNKNIIWDSVQCVSTP